MMFDPKLHNKVLLEPILEERILVVSYPLPPVHIRSIVYMPDSYASKVFDTSYEIPINCGKIITINPSTNGPAILISLKVKDLISPSEKSPYLSINRTSICASVSYAPLGSTHHHSHKFTVTSDVVLDSLSFRSSCNKGSHLVVPGAPHLTALLQWARHPSEEHLECGDITYLSPFQTELDFVNIDFSKNNVIDNTVADISYMGELRNTSNLLSIGSWATKYLHRLRTNHLLKELEHVPSLSTIIDSNQENGRQSPTSSIVEGTDREIRQEISVGRSQDGGAVTPRYPDVPAILDSQGRPSTQILVADSV